MASLRNLAGSVTRRRIRTTLALTPASSTTHVCRRIHTSNPPPRGLSSTVLKALALSGVGATAYGIYRLLVPRGFWPAEVEKDLRSGIKAEHQGDLALSERYLQRAWDVCRTVPRSGLGPDPWLKLSGLASKLAEVLESANQLEHAYDVYAECLDMMQAADGELSDAERHRAVAIALHLSDLADTLGKTTEQGKWLTWSVEKCLLMINSRDDSAATATTDASVPHWVYHENLDNAWEASAAYFAKTGRTERAIEMYTTLLHMMSMTQHLRSSKNPTPENRCKMGQVITSLTGLLISESPTPKNLDDAKKLSTLGLSVVDVARWELVTPKVECEFVWTTLMFNLGAVLEMQNKHEAAKEQFEKSLQHARQIGLLEGVLEAENALARMSHADHSDSMEDQKPG